MVNIEEHVLNIQNKGITILKNEVDLDLIDKVVNDFDNWSSLEENKFKKFNKQRVTDFHKYSVNTKNLVTNINVNKILEKLFNKEQVIYTSLFFREGTAQDYHIDTPHFYTNPIDKYYGVWYALEDINPKAGPLKYYIGSNKLKFFNNYDFFKNYIKNNQNYIHSGYDNEILIEYNKNIEDLCKKNKLEYVDEKSKINKINKGDIIIWHPNLLHGGSDIIDPTLTRYSIVTHNIPIFTQVFNATHFFATEPTNEYLENKCKFKYIKHNNIHMVDNNIPPRVLKGYI